MIRFFPVKFVFFTKIREYARVPTKNTDTCISGFKKRAKKLSYDLYFVL